MVKGYSIQHKISLSFLQKVCEAMRSSGKHPMEGELHVDEFVMESQEVSHMGRSYRGKKKKTVCTVELTEEFKVKRLYVLKVNSLSAKSLQLIFQRYTSENASVSSDKCKGHIPIGNDCKVTQIPSELGLNSEAIHTMIHQVKSWLITTYSWVSKRHIDRYLSEFSYLINRSQTKTTSFHNLIKRMA
jgi:transposase-like protein